MEEIGYAMQDSHRHIADEKSEILLNRMIAVFHAALEWEDHGGAVQETQLHKAIADYKKEISS